MKSTTYGIVLQEKTVKAFEPGSIVEISVAGVGKAIRECVDEIASLRQQVRELSELLDCVKSEREQQLAEQKRLTALVYRAADPLKKQLAECQANLKAEVAYSNKTDVQLAESQAREKMRLEQLGWIHDNCGSVDEFTGGLSELLCQPTDSTALDSVIRQAKREALLEAAESFTCKTYGLVPHDLRRMADELKD